MSVLPAKCSSDDDETLIAQDELAYRWKKSTRTLQRWRKDGVGPAYVQIGGSVRYRLIDVRNYETGMRRGGRH